MEDEITLLSKALSLNDASLLSSTLNAIITCTETSSVVLSEDAVLTFVDILTKSSSAEIQRLSANTIGELAKTETNRNKLSRNDIVLPLIEYSKSTVLEIQKQTCRAIGNLCYENDSVRCLFGKCSVENIVRIIKATLQLENDSNMLLVSCGCLMNLINGNDELQLATLQQPNILQTIEAIIKSQLVQFEQNEACISHVLIILNMIMEYMAADDWLSEGFNCLLVDVLKVSVNPEISGVCLEILQAQSENDSIKLTLAKYGTCQLIHQLVETHKHRIAPSINTNDSLNSDISAVITSSSIDHNRTILKLACDLIILILNGDAAMELLYSSGDGEVYKQMLQWLDDPDVDIVCAGVVALGNFARDDVKCVQMVEDDKVGVKLLRKLSECAELSEQDNMMTKVIFALLSALRNLSIPAINKVKLLNENLIGILLSLINDSTDAKLVDAVVFKLLGTLRMVIDGQEKTSEYLLNQHCFIRKLVHFGRSSEHLGVRGEAPRLLAWLIKNHHSKSNKTEQIISLVKAVPDVVACLVEMLGSMHPVMQNEAILALVLLCASCNSNRNQTDEEKIQAKSTTGPNTNDNTANMLEKLTFDESNGSFEQLLIASKLPSAIHEILQRRHSDSLNAQNITDNANLAFLCNIVSLLEQLVHCETLRRYLTTDVNIAAVLNELLTTLLPKTGDADSTVADVMVRGDAIVANILGAQ